MSQRAPTNVVPHPGNVQLTEAYLLLNANRNTIDKAIFARTGHHRVHTGSDPSKWAMTPLDSVTDLQSHVLGAFPYAITYRPYNPEGCCRKCGSVDKFDLAPNMFAPKNGSGTIEQPCCGNPIINVAWDNGETLTGKYVEPCCGSKVAVVWDSGEEASYRTPAWYKTLCPRCCGPLQYGFYAGLPVELDADPEIVRYKSGETIEIRTNLPGCGMCRQMCSACTCSCKADVNRGITLDFTSHEEIRSIVLQKHMMFTESNFPEGHASDDDVNALFDMRIAVERGCCKTHFFDANTAPEPSLVTAMDAQFRGSYNQNVADKNDYNAILGFLVLQHIFALHNLERNIDLFQIFGMVRDGFFEPIMAGAQNSYSNKPMA